MFVLLRRTLDDFQLLVDFLNLERCEDFLDLLDLENGDMFARRI